MIIILNRTNGNQLCALDPGWPMRHTGMVPICNRPTHGAARRTETAMTPPREPRHWVSLILAIVVATILSIGLAAGLLSLGRFPIGIENPPHHGAKAPPAETAPAAR